MKIRKFLPIIGLLIFAYLIHKVGFHNIVDSFREINPFYFILFFFAIILFTIMQTYKWAILVKNQGINVSFKDLLEMRFIGEFYNFLIPGRFGSLIRIIYLRDKTKKNIGEVSSNIIVDKIIDTFVVFLLAAIGAILLAKQFSDLYWQVGLGFVLLLILILFFKSQKRSKLIFKIIYKFFIPKNLKHKAEESYELFFKSLPSMKSLIWPVSFGLVTWVVNFSAMYILAIAFHLNIPYIYFVTMFPIATIVTLIPITISGLGTRELALIALFSVFSISAADVIALSLTSYILTILLSLIGLYFSFKLDLKA